MFMVHPHGTNAILKLEPTQHALSIWLKGQADHADTGKASYQMADILYQFGYEHYAYVKAQFLPYVRDQKLYQLLHKGTEDAYGDAELRLDKLES
jgi:hypothetical protein